jgi:2-dehydropantoate 2-reductase
MTHGTGVPWPRIAVFGAGAVGCYFGARLALAGAPVVLIGRPSHVEAMRSRGLLLETAGATHPVTVEASVSPSAIAGADIVLLCVKSADTPAAAREIAAHRAPNAIVVSMQNGVDNAERAREAGGFDVLAAVVYVGASMGGPGHVVHAGRGDLVLGAWPGAPAAAVGTVADTFERAGVACRASDDIRAELWTKLVMNATFNAMSALAHARYGALVAAPGAVATMRAIVGECVAVARADGVRLPEADELHAAALRLGQAMAGATSSTEQDLARGRPTEIDALNGYVVRVGDAHGVPVPVNRALHALVGLAERARAGPA